MNLILQQEAPPLGLDVAGTYRVGKSRVLLDLVIDAHREGLTPEATVERYTSLEIADVYAVVAYYLRHQVEVDAYLGEREDRAEQVRQKILNTPEAQERYASLRKRRETT